MSLGLITLPPGNGPIFIAPGEKNHCKLFLVALFEIHSLLQFSSPVPETLRVAYTKLSGTPRRCFQALRPNGDEHEMEKIKHAINDIKNLKDFADSANGFLPFKNKGSHALVRMEPTDDTWRDQITDLLSTHVAELVYERINLHNTISIRDSIDFLLRTPNARSWGGELFELGVHRVFRKGIKFEARPMDDDVPPLIVEIKTAERESSGYFHTLSARAEPGFRKLGDEFLNEYLFPLSSTQETIDAVYISGDVTVFFQMTVSPSHNLNLKGITELTDELPAAAKKRIFIVFVVRSCKPYKRQKIVVPLGVDRDVVETLVGVQAICILLSNDQILTPSFLLSTVIYSWWLG